MPRIQKNSHNLKFIPIKNSHGTLSTPSSKISFILIKRSAMRLDTILKNYVQLDICSVLKKEQPAATPSAHLLFKYILNQLSMYLFILLCCLQHNILILKLPRKRNPTQFDKPLREDESVKMKNMLKIVNRKEIV